MGQDGVVMVQNGARRGGDGGKQSDCGAKGGCECIIVQGGAAMVQNDARRGENSAK